MKVSVNTSGNRVIELESDDVALVLGADSQSPATASHGPVVYLGLNPEIERVLTRKTNGVLPENIVYMKSLHALSADPRFRETVTDIGMKSIGLERIVVN